MKKNFSIFQFFYLIIISLIFISCSNLFENSVAEQESPLETVEVEQGDNSITESPINQEFIFTGNMAFSGAMPEIIADKINETETGVESESENQNARSALPSVDASEVEYFVYAENNFLPTNSAYQKIEGTFGSGSSSKTFSIPLTYGLSWNITCGMRSKTGEKTEFLKASTGSQLYTLADVANPVILYPQPVTSGKGELLLEMTLPPSITSASYKCVSANKASWPSGLGINFSEGNTTTGVNAKATLRTNTNSDYYPPSGVYKLLFTFKKGSQVVFETIQTINVFSGLKTNTWVDSSGSDESARAIKNDGTFVLSDIIITQSDLTTFYVGSVSGGKAVSDSNFGNHKEPLETIAEAFNRIKANGSTTKDYTIYISGEINTSHIIDSDFDSKANSITIRGVAGSSTDILKGSGTARVLSISTSADINLSKLTISNGKANGSGDAAQGGAIYKDGTSKLTIDNCVIQSNQASSGGGAIYLNSGSFEMSNSVLSSNTATGSGGALYIASATGITLCKISDCEFSSNNAKEGGAIHSNAKKASNASAENCTFTGNNATGTTTDNGGGAVKVSSGMYFTINGGTFTGNTAANNKGGAIYNTGTIYLEDDTTTALSIPAGTDNKNDIYLASTDSSNKTLSLIGTFKNTSGIALITPAIYEDGRAVLSESVSGGSAVASAYSKFDLRPLTEEGDCEITSAGTIKLTPVLATIGTTEYRDFSALLAAIAGASEGETITLTVTGAVTAAQFGKVLTEDTIIYAIKNASANINLIVEETAGLKPLTSQQLFFNCKKLITADLRGLDTSGLTSMYGMFGECENLTSLDISSLDTSSVLSMEGMFENCSALTEIIVSDAFVTTKVTSSPNMFSGCTLLKGGADTSYDGDHVDATYAHIDEGSTNPGYFTGKDYYAKVGNTYYDDLESTYNAIKGASGEITVYLTDNIDGSELGTSATTGTIIEAIKSTSATGVNLIIPQRFNLVPETCKELFDGCRKLKTADLRGLNTTGKTDFGNMFYNCDALTSLDVSGFDTSSVTSLDQTFRECKNLPYIDLSTWDTSNVQNLAHTFRNCSGATTIYVSDSFVTSSVTVCIGVFDAIGNKLVGGAGTVCDGTHTNDINYVRIDGGPSAPGYFTHKTPECNIELKEVTVPAATFNGTSAITGSEIFISGRNIGTINSIVASDHEVTQGEYETYCIYGYDPANTTTNIQLGPRVEKGRGVFYSAYFVNWYDALVYCNLRSIAEGYTPVYKINGSTNPAAWPDVVQGTGPRASKYCGPKVQKPDWDNVVFDTGADGWRLPTEIEWEYLARGGKLTNSDQTIFSGSDTYDSVGYHVGNSDNQIHYVKQKTPNALQIYDMSGNECEYVWDFHNGDIFETTGILGVETGTKREVRGGGYNSGTDWGKVYYREVDNPPTARYINCGFRVVRGVLR